MRKLKLTKSLLLNLSLSILLIPGLYSCGGENDNDMDSATETEEIIVTDEAEDLNQIDIDQEESTNSEERESMTLSSESEDVELDVDYKSMGFDDVYHFSDVDQPPMFDECEAKYAEEAEECFEKFIMKSIGDNIIYPENAKELNVEGKSYVAFVVDKTGVIGEVKVMRGAGYAYENGDDPINEYIDAYNALDDAAVTALNSTPKIRPAMLDNTPVNVQYTIPIAFKVE